MIQGEDTPDTDKGLTQRQLIHLMYALFAVGILSAGILGAAAVAAVVLAYLKRGDMVGTVYAGHIDWIIRTFWWGLLWLVLSALAAFIFIGFITGVVAMVWIIYRLAKGWLAHCAGETPLPGL
ncbi:hypothetical protein [uncultured Castellaniella sp.]|uniref:DUF4870 family protein n=1 Tax=uncultured Castellaniella sp. TaxID=647907 RepID=UPI00262D623B|nr:hypothetical protein [uncultured Castellaniella sp.]